MNRYIEVKYLSLGDLKPGPVNPWTARIGNQGILDFIFKTTGMAQPVSDDEYTNTLFQDYIWPRFYTEAIVKVKAGDTEQEKQEKIDRVLGSIYSWVMGTKDNYGYLINAYETKRAELLGQVKTSQTTDSTDSGKTSSTSTNTNDATTDTTSSATNNIKVNTTPQIELANPDSDDFVNAVNRGQTTGTDKVKSNTAGSASTTGETSSTGKTTTVIGSDAGTLMARIKEVSDNIENIYVKWSDEFKDFIIW